MRRFLLWAGGFLLIFAAVSFTLTAVITAFGFLVKAYDLIFIWLTTCLAASVLSTLWRGKGLLLYAPPLLIWLHYKLPEIISGGKRVAFFISKELSVYFPMPVLFRYATASVEELTLFFGCVGAALALLLAISVCVRRSAVFTFFLTFPIAALSLIIEAYAPNPWFIAALFAIYVTMTIMSALYPDDLSKRGLALFPALALAGLLFGVGYLVAQPGDNTRADLIISMDLRINSLFSKGGFNWRPINSALNDMDLDIRLNTWIYNKDYAAVADAGSRTETGQTILKVSASRSGTFYLRGYSLQIFDGRSWRNGASSPDIDNYQRDTARPLDIAFRYSELFSQDAPETVNMSVEKTGDASNLIYIPYYTFSGVEADSSEESYDITFYDMGSAILKYAEGMTLTASDYLPDYSEYNEQARTAYTQVEPDTASRLRELAMQAGIDPYADRASIADHVADFVSSSAQYTLSPPDIPGDADSTLYFLETSKAGYCVHFATAATLMLRALDIPARFTNGFVITIPNGRTSAEVTDKQAHAWVEVYYDDIGWVPLETTPSAASSAVPERTAHTPPDPQSEDSVTEPETPLPQQPTETTTDQELPIGDIDGTINQKEPDTGVSSYSSVLYAVFSVAVVLVAVCLRRHIARVLRKKSFSQADTNAAVISAWRYIVNLQGKEKPPEEIEELALKAKFSLHTMSVEELDTVVNYATRLSRDTDRRLNSAQRLWYRYVRGLY